LDVFRSEDAERDVFRSEDAERDVASGQFTAA
jgi:hypothetical protein